jgi:hypothetical protein
VTKGEQNSVPKRIAGVALMLLGAALIGYGAHYLAENGNCSSTGYASYGPVPKCGGGEGLYITSVFFLGPLVIFVGWALAQLWGLLWPMVCVATAAGLVTIRADSHAAPDAKAFGLGLGSCFAALALVSVGVSIRKLRRPKTTLAGLPGPAAGLASSGATAMASPPLVTAAVSDWRPGTKLA